MGYGSGAMDFLKGRSEEKVDRRRQEVPGRQGLRVLCRRPILAGHRLRQKSHQPGTVPRASEICEVSACRRMLGSRDPPAR